MATKAMKKIFAKHKKKGHRGLTEKECCALVLYQLGEIAKWEFLIWDRLYGTGGGGTPPPPPKWPPA